MKKGFTLIELTIVIAVLGILAATLIPKLASQIDNVKSTVSVKDVYTIISALNLYHIDHDSYPIASTCTASVKSNCGLSSIKDPLSPFMPNIPYSNVVDSSWSFGSGYLVPLKNEYGYIGRGSYYILSYFFFDKRDGRLYRAVRMPDNKWWMADDLQYVSSNSWCYNGLSSGCDDAYGRLYRWADAPTVCPQNWRLPTDDERYNMLTTIEVINKNTSANHYRLGFANGSAGLYLKKDVSGVTSNDIFGFSAMIGGMGNSVSSSYSSRGTYGFYWTSTMTGSSVYFRRFEYNRSWVYYSTTNPSVQNPRYAIRCVRD